MRKKFYLEDLQIDPDYVEDAIREELQELGINFTKFYSIEVAVEYVPQEDDNEINS
jgi:hypothetical protein